ncbi:MAG: GTP-binding protein [Elainellaceae cyanobacterium]
MANRVYLAQAQACLERTLDRYRLGSTGPSSADLALKAELEEMSEALEALEEPVIRIAVFGMVSRGKSAVINALVGKKLLKTGPLHGVTQWPRSVYWAPSDDVKVELVDTPGLGEVEGAERATMARTVIDQADLVLFVVAGELTYTEYAALQDLWREGKPLLLVFNKIDQYPEHDQQSLAQALKARSLQVVPGYVLGQTLPEPAPQLDASGSGSGSESLAIAPPAPKLSLKPDRIVPVAADPAPQKVQVDWPDGRTTYEWETPPPQIGPLKERLLDILHQDGAALVALRALQQAQQTEAAIAKKSVSLHQEAASDLIWTFARWKSIVVAVNPVAGLDLAGGALSDLVMIRALARLYGLPMTSHGAKDLWNAIVWSAGGLLVGEFGSGLILGFGKSAMGALTAVSGGAAIGAYASTAIAQGTLAGYGAYRVGKAAQTYLENGCTWGPDGISAAIQQIFSQIDRDSVLHRLRQDLS